MKKWKQTAGFTLVELIVVIAILGILAGVGTVGYSGYIKKANMSADQQMVTGMIDALELAAISDYAGFPSSATVKLGQNGASVVSGDGIDAALSAAYGAGWESACKLKYNGWGVSNTIYTAATTLKGKLNTTGYPLSYQAEADVNKLWSEAEDILLRLEDSTAVAQKYGSSADLLNSAAAFTQDMSKYTGVDGSTSAEDAFALTWGSHNNFNSISASAYNSNSQYASADDLNPLLAKYAAIKARNCAFATYLEKKPGMEGVAANIRNLTSGLSAGGVNVPDDFLTVINGSGGIGRLGATGKEEALGNALEEYFGEEVAHYETSTESIAVNSGITSRKNTRAYADALGYYALMNAVTETRSENPDMESGEYLDLMAGAVKKVSGVLTAATEEEQKAAAEAVYLTAEKTESGLRLSVELTDPRLDLKGRARINRVTSGGSNAGNENENVISVTLDVVGTSLVPVNGQNITMNKGDVAVIKYALGPTASQGYEAALQGNPDLTKEVFIQNLISFGWKVSIADSTYVTVTESGTITALQATSSPVNLIYKLGDTDYNYATITVIE